MDPSSFLRLNVQDVGWMDRSACREPSLVPPQGGRVLDWFYGQYTYNIAKKICARCQVQDECLDYVEPFERMYDWCSGVAAGMTPNERRALYRRKDEMRRTGRRNVG